MDRLLRQETNPGLKIRASSNASLLRKLLGYAGGCYHKEALQWCKELNIPYWRNPRLAPRLYPLLTSDQQKRHAKMTLDRIADCYGPAYKQAVHGLGILPATTTYNAPFLTGAAGRAAVRALNCYTSQDWSGVCYDAIMAHGRGSGCACNNDIEAGRQFTDIGELLMEQFWSAE